MNLQHYFPFHTSQNIGAAKAIGVALVGDVVDVGTSLKFKIALGGGFGLQGGGRNFKEMRAKQIEGNNAKKQKNFQKGFLLSAAKKKAGEQEVEIVSTPRTFTPKSNPNSMPSKVEQPQPIVSPLKPIRDNRSKVKCGYSSFGEGCTRGEGHNPFNVYTIQNTGVLQTFLHVCCDHTRECTGQFNFIQTDPSQLPAHLRGTLFSTHTVQCTDCGKKVNLESDYFESKVDVAVSSSCFSRVSKLAALASKNMSWVFNEMEMLFSVLGVGFFTSSKFGVLREEQL